MEISKLQSGVGALSTVLRPHTSGLRVPVSAGTEHAGSVQLAECHDYQLCNSHNTSAGERCLDFIEYLQNHAQSTCSLFHGELLGRTLVLRSVCFGGGQCSLSDTQPLD